jgi:hypothetical protein
MRSGACSAETASCRSGCTAVGGRAAILSGPARTPPPAGALTPAPLCLSCCVTGVPRQSRGSSRLLLNPDFKTLRADPPLAACPSETDLQVVPTEAAGGGENDVYGRGIEACLAVPPRCEVPGAQGYAAEGCRSQGWEVSAARASSVVRATSERTFCRSLDQTAGALLTAGAWLTAGC